MSPGDQGEMTKAQEEGQALAESTSIEVPSKVSGDPTASLTRRETQGGESPRGGYNIWKYHMRYDPITILFTLLVFIGGLIGYAKGSSISLISATIFAFFLGAGTFLEGTGRGVYLLLLTLISLFSLMLYRTILAGKLMPSGMVAALSLLMIIRHGYLLYARRSV